MRSGRSETATLSHLTHSYVLPEYQTRWRLPGIVLRNSSGHSFSKQAQGLSFLYHPTFLNIPTTEIYSHGGQRQPLRFRVLKKLHRVWSTHCYNLHVMTAYYHISLLICGHG